MNDSVPVVAKPSARDHAPPDRGQEPAPSDAFAAVLGAAQPAEAPPPAADPNARTAPAEGTKAEGDSSGPHIRKAARARAQAPAMPPVPGTLAASVAAAPAALTPGSPAVSPAAVPASTSATPPPAVPATAPAAEATQAAAAQGLAPVPVAADDAARPASRTQTAVPAADRAAPKPEQPSAPEAEAVLEAEGMHAVKTGRPVRTPQHEAASRTARPERTRGRSERAARPAPTTAAARPAPTKDVPMHRVTTPASSVEARPADAAAPAPAPAEAQVQPAGRTTEPARLAEHAVPSEPQEDAHTRVRLRDVPDVARATLRVAVKSNGGATARISLHPADLGGVRITMRVHDGTVAATLAAETPAAAQALAQTASDLRRSLEGQGLQIASLDVHVAGDGPASSGGRQTASDLALAMNDNDRATSDDVVDITTELHLVPLGTQVDVLA
jgi:flagellar hook-length control protein FliK